MAVRFENFRTTRPVAASAIPEEEDRLVACLIREYSKATGHVACISMDRYKGIGQVAIQFVT